MNRNHQSTKRCTCAWSLTLLSVLFAGCSGKVDLGGAARPLTPKLAESSPTEAEAAAGTVSVARFEDANFTGLAADGIYLYFMTMRIDGTYCVERCEKANCRQTWKLLHSFPASQSGPKGFKLESGRLGWIDLEQGLERCSAPDCADPSPVDGVVVDGVYHTTDVTWDEEFVYFSILVDESIYRCRPSECVSNPTLLTTNAHINEMVTSNTHVENMVSVDGFLYWGGGGAGIMRVAKDGSSAGERLALDTATAWSALSTTTPEDYPDRIWSFALDGPWIYGTLTADVSNSTNDASLTHVVRWRHSEPGAAREVLVEYDAVVENYGGLPEYKGILYASDGEVVWVSADGTLWSCLGDSCAATKRQLGTNADIAVPGANGDYAASDDQYIHWLSMKCPENCDFNWNLKRTPRIPK